MKNFKHVIDKNGYWISISTSGSIKLTNKWNLTNNPSNHHKWNGLDFVLDEESLKADLINQVKATIFTKCDALQDKLVKNESYSYDDKYQETKDSITLGLQNTRAVLATLSDKTIYELKVLMKEV